MEERSLQINYCLIYLYIMIYMKDIYNNYNSILFFKSIKWYLEVYNFKIRKA